MRVKITPVKQIKPIILLDRGEITKVTGVAYVAGQLPIKVRADVNVNLDLVQSREPLVMRQDRDPSLARAFFEINVLKK